jgi:hypothetical protein
MRRLGPKPAETRPSVLVREAFHAGDFVTAALKGESDQWESHAARGLIVDPHEGIRRLTAFDLPEARFYSAVLSWMAGDEDRACRELKVLSSPHAVNLLNLIKKRHIHVLSQIPRTNGGCFVLLDGVARDTKFQIHNISSSDGDLRNSPAASTSEFFRNHGPMDFFVCAMIEFNTTPTDIGQLPCPTMGYTSDYDAHILSAAPWLKAFDHVMVCDHVIEWTDVCAIKGSSVFAFPLVFSAPRELLPLERGARDIDVFFSGTMISGYQPDKGRLVHQLLRIPDLKLVLIDGHLSFENYYALLARSKITQSYCRHPGAMLTRAIECLSMGSIALVQESSVHELWGGEGQGIFTFDDSVGPEAAIRRILADYDVHGDACWRGASSVRQAFSPEVIASRFFRFCTFLAAKPRTLRNKVDFENLDRRRHVFIRGFRASYEELGRECQTILESLTKRALTNPSLSLQNTKAREAALLHSEALYFGYPLPANDLGFERAIAELQLAVHTAPEALVPRYNLMRLLIHLGNEAQLHQGLVLAAEILDMPAESWQIEILDDIYPYDFFTSWMNHRTYFDTVVDGLAGRGSPELKLRDLILASVHHFFAVYEGSIAHAEGACRLDPVWPIYKLTLADMYGSMSDVVSLDRAHDLLVELTKESWIAVRAFHRLQALAERHKPSEVAAAETAPIIARAQACMLFTEHHLEKLESEFARRGRVRRQGQSEDAVLKKLAPAVGLQISFIVCGQAGTGCETVLQGLAQQNASRRLFEVIYVECFDFVRPELIALSDTVIACSQDSFLEHRLAALSVGLKHAQGEIVVFVEPGRRPFRDLADRILSVFLPGGNAITNAFEARAANFLLLAGWFDSSMTVPRFVALPKAHLHDSGGLDVHNIFAGNAGTPLELAWRCQQSGIPVMELVADGAILKRIPAWWNAPPFDGRSLMLSASKMIWPHLLSEQRLDPMISGEILKSGNVSVTPENVGSFLNFNIVRRQGRYIALRQELGPVDCRIGVSSLFAQLGSENSIVGDNLDRVRANIVVRSRNLSNVPAPVAAPVLIDSLQTFNIVFYNGDYFGLRQSLGAVDCRRGRETLLEHYGGENIVVAKDLDGAKQKISSLLEILP